MSEEQHVSADDKLRYARNDILPALRKAFERGEQKYTGIQHSHSAQNLARTPEQDVEHVHEVHVAVRLREAQHHAEYGERAETLAKIESAIGYLTILHMRLAEAMEEEPETDA